MSIRRLARLGQDTNGNQQTNWTTQATETYNAATPAAGPVSWGTDPEIANLDRDFDATGSTKQHLGLLATITAGPDVFWGAVVKLQVTYSGSDDPKLELWTHDSTNGWVIQRRLDVPVLARSGDPTIFDLTLAQPLAGIDQVWITLNPTSTETNNWVANHLYGDCTAALLPPGCPPLSVPADCSLTWPETPGGLPEPIPVPPDAPAPIPAVFPVPPITVDIPNPGSYSGTSGDFFAAPNNHWRVYLPPNAPGNDGKWRKPCPGPRVIRMYFSIRHGSEITVAPLNLYPLAFVEGASQTVSGDTFIDWTVSIGFTPANPNGANQYLYPAAIHPFTTFGFTPKLNFSVLDFFDWEAFLWTFEIKWGGSEIC